MSIRKQMILYFSCVMIVIFILMVTKLIIHDLALTVFNKSVFFFLAIKIFHNF